MRKYEGKKYIWPDTKYISVLPLVKIKKLLYFVILFSLSSESEPTETEPFATIPAPPKWRSSGSATLILNNKNMTENW
jgi:hypothetical protein